MITSSGNSGKGNDGLPQSNRGVGWLPVDIRGRYATVRWMRTHRGMLADAFFDAAVSRLRSGSPPASEHETDIEILIGREPQHQEKVPAGLVIHMSRCGSTLLMNA